MLKIEDLRFSYSRRSAPVLNGVDLELRDGEIGILLGKNGSGKTTLFKNILGIGTPSGGTIRFDGEDLLKLPKRDRARRIAYVPQHIHFGALTVYDSILMGRVSYFGLRAGKEDYDVVDRIMAEMKLESFADRNADDGRVQRRAGDICSPARDAVLGLFYSGRTGAWRVGMHHSGLRRGRYRHSHCRRHKPRTLPRGSHADKDCECDRA